MTLSFGLGQGFEIVFLTVKVISDLKPEVELIFKESKGEIIGTGSRKCGTSKVFFVEPRKDKTTSSIDQMTESIGMQKRTDG